jgi:hypothetical protein
MEKMVTDPDICKVILVCDKKYAEKADGREGRVGTEAQIISPEVYKKQAQDKFVAVIKERDDEGNPYVPVYYRSRIHIDLSEGDCRPRECPTSVAQDPPLFNRTQIGVVDLLGQADFRGKGTGTPACARRSRQTRNETPLEEREKPEVSNE